MNLEIIGYVATLASGLHLIPEILKALRTHHLRDLAWGMLILMTTSSVLWVTYGITNHIIPVGISSSINLSFDITLIILKIRYDRQDNSLSKKRAKAQTAIQPAQNPVTE